MVPVDNYSWRVDSYMGRGFGDAGNVDNYGDVVPVASCGGAWWYCVAPYIEALASTFV